MPLREPRILERIQRLERVDLWSRRFTTFIFPPPDDRWESNKRRYEYKIISPPPKQTDPVLNIIKQIIRDLSKEDPYLAAADVHVWNATSSPPLWPLSPANYDVGVKLYLFKEEYEEFHSTHPVRIIPRNHELTADMIEVRHRKKWLPLKAWLERFPSRNYVERVCSTESVQRAWWDKNGKTFPFMELPKEVRLILLQHIMGELFYPRVETSSSGLSSRVTLSPYGRCIGGLDGYDSRSVNYSITKVSKLVREESVIAAWRGTFKRFTTSEGFLKVVGCPHAPMSSNWLTKVNLTFNVSQYFTFFGATVHPFMQYNQAQAPANILATMTDLKSFEMIFLNPDSECSNPWRDWWFEIGDSQIRTQYERMRGAFCYTPVTDWILTFAYPFIKQIPKVFLSGYIKTSIRKKWELILQNEYLLKNEDYRTHGYDWTTAIQEIQLLTESELPPACHCPLPCMRGRSNMYAEADCPKFDFDDTWVPPDVTT